MKWYLMGMLLQDIIFGYVLQVLLKLQYLLAQSVGMSIFFILMDIELYACAKIRKTGMNKRLSLRPPPIRSTPCIGSRGCINILYGCHFDPAGWERNLLLKSRSLIPLCGIRDDNKAGFRLTNAVPWHNSLVNHRPNLRPWIPDFGPQMTGGSATLRDTRFWLNKWV